MLQEKLNTQIRDVCLAILIKKNSHFRFRSLFSLKVQSNSMEDVAQTIFLVFFFSFKEKKIPLQLISTGNPLIQTAHCFFFSNNAFNDQRLVNQHGRCSSNIFFSQRKIYRSFQREIPCCRLGTSLTPLVLITHSILFSFPLLLLRLREVHFIGCD